MSPELKGGLNKAIKKADELVRADNIVTTTIRDAFEAFSPQDSFPNLAIYVGDRTIGREHIGMSADAHGIHRDHYIYYYEWSDPTNPNMRLGIEGEGRRARLYTVQNLNGKAQIEYKGRLSTDKAMSRLKSMPRGKGNLVGL